MTLAKRLKHFIKLHNLYVQENRLEIAFHVITVQNSEHVSRQSEMESALRSTYDVRRQRAQCHAPGSYTVFSRTENICEQVAVLGVQPLETKKSNFHVVVCTLRYHPRRQ
jgi:hypothetical protein